MNNYIRTINITGVFVSFFTLNFRAQKSPTEILSILKVGWN